MTSSSSDEPRATALIGDLSGSQELSRQHRANVQASLTTLLQTLNVELEDALLSNFTVTLGDEFQGLLCQASVIPEILWRLRVDLPAVRLWVGVGFGGLDTPIHEEAIGMDGPTFHRARQGVDLARDESIHGGVFVGFDEDDAVLTGLARLLDHHRHSFTEAQIAAVAGVREGRRQSDVAEELGISRQAVSKHLKTAGWDVYEMGEEALRELLARNDTDDEWER